MLKFPEALGTSQSTNLYTVSERDSREFRSKNIKKRIPNNLILESDTSDCNHSDGIGFKSLSERLIDTRNRSIVSSRSPHAVGSQKHRPPASDPRFRKIHKPNPLTTQSEVTFDNIKPPTDTLSSSSQVIKEMAAPTSTLRPDIYQYMPSFITANQLDENDRRVISHNACQTDSSVFNIAHNISQTDPISSYLRTIPSDSEINFISSDYQRTEYLDTRSKQSSNVEVPNFSEWLAQEKKFETIMEPRPRKGSTRSTSSTIPSFYSAKSSVKDEYYHTHKGSNLPKEVIYEPETPYTSTQHIPTEKQGFIDPSIKAFQPKTSIPRTLSSSFLRLKEDLPSKQTVSSLINMVLLVIAFTFASLVILVCFYIMQPVVYDGFDYIISIIFQKEEVVENAFLNDTLVWFYNIVKDTVYSLFTVLSKKRECSVSLFTPKTRCSS